MVPLLLVLVLAQAPGSAAGPGPQSASDELGRFLQEWKEAMAEMTRTHAEAKGEAQVKAWNDDNQRRTHAFGERALALAARHPGTPEAVCVLSWVVNQGYSPEAGRALATLRRDYITSPRLGPACADTRRHVLGGFEEVEAFLRAALASSPHREVRGQACFALAIYLQWHADTIAEWMLHPEYAEFFEPALGADRMKRVRGRDRGQLVREAGELFERVAAEFADLKDRRGRLLGERAKGELAELRDLKVGRAAPEVAGKDADGRDFRLSDYLGRVVVLSFSGNWCGPCRAAYPHERDLMERLKGRPFALLGVNTDADAKTLRKSIDAGEITWRCWADGGVDGPITQAWGVDTFPAVYVLDAAGIIRFKNVQGKDLDDAVDRLLAEVKPAG